MATDWFYYIGDQRIGPVGSQQLKDLAKSGEVQPDNLVWKEGMSKPQPASKVKGLFEPPNFSSAPPTEEAKASIASEAGTGDSAADAGTILAELGHAIRQDALNIRRAVSKHLQPTAKPARQLSESTSVETVDQTKQPGFVESLKTAGTLAAKQADLARIKNVSLSAAFQKLGKSVFEGNIGRAELTADYAAIDDLRNQITAKVESAKNAPAPQGFAQQAKAMAKATADAAQKQLLQVRLAHAITRLGQSAYERRIQIALPQQLVDGVEAIHQHISELEAVIQKLGEEKPGQAIKHSLATEGSALGRSLLNNRLIQVCLIPFCGLGLLLIFRSPSWSRRAKLYWAGGFATIMVIGFVGNMQERKTMTAALAEANSLWEGKKAAEAIDKYGVILHRHWSMLDQSDRSTLIRRVVEFDVRNGNEAAAKELLQKVVANHVAVTFDDERANRLQRSVIAEAEEQKKRQAEAVVTAAQQKSDDDTNANKGPDKGRQAASGSGNATRQYSSGREFGSQSGLGLESVIRAIQIEQGNTQKERNSRLRSAIYDFTEQYDAMLKNRDEMLAQHANASAIEADEWAKGFRDGFNANCKSYQLRAK